jgi:hypothetical protein
VILARQDHGSPVDPAEGLGGNGRAVRPDGGTNGHEEASDVCQHTLEGLVRYAHPKVAADPIMYCPSVRSIPLGPGPKRTMFVNPGEVRKAAHEGGNAHRR